MKLPRRLGIMAAVALLPSSRESILLASEIELTKTVGRAIGLDDEQTSEVIATWMDWYRTTLYEPDWQRIRWALKIRWGGQEDWRPRLQDHPFRVPGEPVPELVPFNWEEKL